MSYFGFRIEDGVPWIGEKPFPWAEKVNEADVDTDSLKWRSRGFWLKFENGYTLSVQFGTGNYCANRDFPSVDSKWHEDCPDAEIALWDRHDAWYEWEDDTVRGWCTPDEVLTVIETVSSWPNDEFGPNPIESGKN